MKIMVTGSEGFIGSHLMRSLEARGHEMVGIDREIDVAKMESIGAAMNAARPDTVIHCAAIAGVAECERDRATAFQTNVIGTFTVAGAAAAFGVKRFIHFSTGGHMYGSIERLNTGAEVERFQEHHTTAPPSYYGETKLMSEAALLAAVGDSGMQPVILRPSNIYGPGGRGACEVIARAMLDGEIVHVTDDGYQARDYIHIDDVARLVTRVVENSPRPLGERGLGGVPTIFNVSTGVSHSVNEIVQRLRALLDWHGEIAHESERTFDPKRVRLGSELAQRVWDWAPRIAFEHGIETVIPVRA